MKSFVCFFLLLLFSLVTTAQVVKDVSIKFDKNDFVFKYDDEGNLFIVSNVHRVSYKSDTQEPALPFVQINLLIENNNSYENVQIHSDEELLLKDVLLAPNPHVVKTDSTPTDYESMPTITYTNEVYPKLDIHYSGTHILGGYKYVSFIVSPFKYDALRKKLYLRTNMTLSVNLSDNDNKGLVSETNSKYVTHDKTILSRLKKLVINYNQFEELYGHTNEAKNTDNTITSRSTIDYEYLIITNNALKSSFQDLVKWKTIKGIRSKIITTEQISSQYSGISLQEKIKRAIKDYYNGTYSGLKYVMLGGDVDIVPSRMCHIGYIENDTVYHEETTPVDMYYGCFDGDFGWDANGNGIFGETGDNVDLLPEVVVTRMPVNTPEQVSSYVSRVINYERLSNIEGCEKKILMGGHTLRFWYDGMCDSEVKADSFYVKYIQPYWNCERKKLFNKQEGDSASLFCRDSLQYELGKGYTFADIITHGMPSCWSMRSLDYNTTYAQNLTNLGNTVITTVACHTNAFDSSLCLSEAFIRNKNSGMLGYLGCSRQGWANIWPWRQGPSFEYNGDFYKSLFTDSYGMFGRAVINAKDQYAPLCIDESTVYRWIMFGLNPIGDPETRLFLDVPNRFDPNISYLNGTISVDTGVSDCTICVSSMDDLGQSYYQVVTGNQASFSNIVTDVCVCITKPGYIPFFIVCGDGGAVFVQNEVITGNYCIAGSNVLAGGDVTSQIPQGPVVIQDGNVNIHGTNGVTLKNNFKVRVGASLNITTGN